MKLEIQPKLPWEARVIAYMKTERDEHYIITVRQDEHTPFVVHRYDPTDGSCMWGNYCSTRADAVWHLMTRTGMLKQMNDFAGRGK